MNRPTSYAEIRNNKKMISCFDNLSELENNDLPALFITSVVFNPESEEHFQADLAFVKLLVMFPYSFFGYVEVICDTPEELLFECYCHFLSESVDSDACKNEINRIRALFIKAGFSDPSL
jgi:hypothetical protein